MVFGIALLTFGSMRIYKRMLNRNMWYVNAAKPTTGCGLRLTWMNSRDGRRRGWPAAGAGATAAGEIVPERIKLLLTETPVFIENGTVSHDRIECRLNHPVGTGFFYHFR
jgi:hypothetical protein